MIYTQVSDWQYTHKPTDPKEKARISGKQHFHNREMTEEAFYEALREGHGFCPLHRDQAQAYTSQTNIVVFDFDHSTIPLDEFIKGLTIKPSFSYYSFSNGKGGQFRFRIIYQLSTPIEGYQYDEVHEYIAQTNGWMPASKGDGDNLNTYDPLARNQYFFSGTSISYYPNNNIEYTHTQPKPAPKSEKRPRQTQANTTTTAYFTDDFIKNFGRLSPHAYAQLTAEHAYAQLTAEGSDYITHTPLPQVDNNTPIIEYPKGYVETPRRLWWDSHSHTYYVKKWEDGEQRHRKIYMASIIIRRLNPQLTPHELLFATAHEFATYYSNDDKKYTTADLIRIVERVLSADTGRELGKWKRKGYIVNTSYCKKHGVSKRSVVGEQNGIRQAAERDKRYEQIAQWYDPSKTDAANLLTLHNAGIKCSIRTLKRYKQAYGYSTQAPKAEPAPKETPIEQEPPKAEPAPAPKPKEKHPTPTKDAPQQPIKPNRDFDRAYTDTDAERIKKMLRRGLNNSSTII